MACREVPEHGAEFDSRRPTQAQPKPQGVTMTVATTDDARIDAQTGNWRNYPDATTPLWLVALDDAVSQLALDAVELYEQAHDVLSAVNAITDEMAIEAGYRSANALVTERYKGVFKQSEPKIIVPTLRRAGWSQDAVAAMCGKKRGSVASIESRARAEAREAARASMIENVARNENDHGDQDDEPVDGELVPDPEPQAPEPPAVEAETVPEAPADEPEAEAEPLPEVTAYERLSDVLTGAFTKQRIAELSGRERANLKRKLNAIIGQLDKAGK